MPQNNYGVRGMAGYMNRGAGMDNRAAANEGFRLAPGQQLPPEFYGVQGPDDDTHAGETMPYYIHGDVSPVRTIGRGANRLSSSDVQDAAGRMAMEGQGLTPIGDGSPGTGYVQNLTGGLSLAALMAYPSASNSAPGGQANPNIAPPGYTQAQWDAIPMTERVTVIGKPVGPNAMGGLTSAGKGGTGSWNLSADDHSTVRDAASAFSGSPDIQDFGHGAGAAHLSNPDELGTFTTRGGVGTQGYLGNDPTPAGGGMGWAATLGRMSSGWTNAQRNAALLRMSGKPQFAGG